MEKKILNKYYNSNNLEQKISRKIFLEKKNEKNKNNSEKHTIHSTTSSLNSKFDNILILDEESNIKDENSLNKEFKKENEETVSKIKIENFNILNNKLKNLKQKINKTVFLEEKNVKFLSTTSSLNSKFDNILILDDESNIKDENSLNKEFKKENEETVSDNKIEIIDNFYHNEEIDENIEININNVFLGKKKNRYSN